MLQKLLDKKNRKGFTMIEMLIVVAIIAILIAIAIPMYFGLLEKTRETADLANIRAAYGEAMTRAIESGEGNGYSKVPNLQQTQEGWNKVKNALIHNYTTADIVPDGHLPMCHVLKGMENIYVVIVNGNVYIGEWDPDHPELYRDKIPNNADSAFESGTFSTN